MRVRVRGRVRVRVRVRVWVTCPTKSGLNWFMPALAKRSVGSSYGTTGDEGTIVWPLDSKYSMNCERTLDAVHWPS